MGWLKNKIQRETDYHQMRLDVEVLKLEQKIYEEGQYRVEVSIDAKGEPYGYQLVKRRVRTRGYREKAEAYIDEDDTGSRFTNHKDVMLYFKQCRDSDTRGRNGWMH